VHVLDGFGTPVVVLLRTAVVPFPISNLWRSSSASRDPRLNLRSDGVRPDSEEWSLKRKNQSRDRRQVQKDMDFHAGWSSLPASWLLRSYGLNHSNSTYSVRPSTEASCEVFINFDTRKSKWSKRQPMGTPPARIRGGGPGSAFDIHPSPFSLQAFSRLLSPSGL
jgi:hypothetical protein